MWPSDQRLEGGMMTYRGRGHIEVKVHLLGITKEKENHSNGTIVARKQETGNSKPKPKPSPLQQHGSKVIALETA